MKHYLSDTENCPFRELCLNCVSRHFFHPVLLKSLTVLSANKITFLIMSFLFPLFLLNPLFAVDGWFVLENYKPWYGHFSATTPTTKRSGLSI